MKNAFFAFMVCAFLGIGSTAFAGGHGQVLRVVQPQFVVVQPQAILVNPYAQALVVDNFHFQPQRIVVQRQRVVVQQRVVQQRVVVRQRAALEIRGPFGGRLFIGR